MIVRLAIIIFTGAYFFNWLLNTNNSSSGSNVLYAISAIAAAVWCVCQIIGEPDTPRP